MKFQEGFSGEYDASTNTFKFAGTTASGSRSELILPITSPDLFMAWIAACLRVSGIKSGTLQGAITTNKIGFSIYSVAESLSALVLDVDTFGSQIAFAIPARNLSHDESAAIQHHLGTALALLERADNGARPN